MAKPLIIRKSDTEPRFLSRGDTYRILLEGKSEKYLSGNNTRVYFENILVDDITAMSYKTFQMGQPVYGLDSFTFDHLLLGSRRVEGQFTINFRDSGYMYWLMGQIQKILGGIDPGQELLISSEEVLGNTLSNAEYATSIESTGLTSLLTVNEFVDTLKGNTPMGTGTANWRELASRLRKRAFGAFQDVSKRAAAAFEEDKDNRPRYTGNFNYGASKIFQEGFNIYVVYEADELWYTKPELRRLRSTKSGSEDKLGEGGTAGDTSIKKDDMKARSPGTVRVFSGVRITTGPDQDVGEDGLPLQETYSFLAKDVDVTSNLAVIEKLPFFEAE